MTIRPHRRTDADRIAEILADGWRDTYPHIVPATHLAFQSDRERRRTEIADWLDDFHHGEEAVFVAEDEGRIVGFTHIVLGDKSELGCAGFVNLLYVDANAHGRRLGSRLMAAAARWLLDVRPGPLALSAFERNPHRAFYAALGGVETKRVVNDIAGAQVCSVLYLWPDPAMLVDRR